MERMRIAYVVTVPMTAWSFLRGQLRHLAERNEAVALVCSPDPLLTQLAEQERITLVEVPMEREISPRHDLRSVWNLWRAFRKFRPQITNVGTPKAGLLGGLAAVLARVPHRIYTLHGLRMETASGWKRRLLFWAERLSTACAHQVVCVGPSLRERAVELGLVRRSKTVVLGKGSVNGVDAERFAPNPTRLAEAAELRKRLQIPEDAPVIGFVGRLTRDKGIEELVIAFAQIRACRSAHKPEPILLCVGDYEAGDPVTPITRRALEETPGIIRTGFVADASVYYHLMDVLALPTYREGFPYVPLEAAAAGKPVITTRVTGARDAVIDGETGYLIPPRDPQALAAALSRVLQSPAAARCLGAAGRERVLRDFRPQDMWQAWEKLYQSPVPATRIYPLLKRTVDLLGSSIGLLFAAPLLTLAAVAIWLEDRGSPWFRQERVGQDGRLFRMWKLRSMIPNAQSKGLGLSVAHNDNRITRVGKFLRASSLDELPQLLNVWQGDMSLIGPRPTVASQVANYTDFQRRRLEVRPGLTGWAQVNGRNSISWERRIELDVDYVDRCSFLLDLQILLRTPAALLPSVEGHYGKDGIVEDLKPQQPAADTAESERRAA